jgi:hypothetical protein
MSDEPEVGVYPHGLEDEFPDGPPTVLIRHRGCRLVLKFRPGDFRGKGPLQELRLLPDKETLKPGVLLRFVPEGPRYLAYARAAMRIFEGEDEPSRRSRRDAFRAAGEDLREIAGPGRGLSDRFYRLIAENYEALVADGNPHPVKELARIHHVTISAASRWLKEARRRGHVSKVSA